jgi:broad specificity phosphatase PhoE
VTRLILVRHGDAAAGWSEHADPGLSDLGHAQAREMAATLAPLGPLPVWVSPMRRCRETAAPLAEQWGVDVVVEPRVGEIEAPDHDVATRGPWLHDVLGKTWPELPAAQQAWRDGVLASLLGLAQPCVVVTHFVAINAAIGAATADDRVVCHRVGNCSTITFDTNGTSLTLVSLSAEPDATEVL